MPATGTGVALRDRHPRLAHVTRPGVCGYYADPAEAAAGARQAVGHNAGGKVNVTVGGEYALTDGAGPL